MLFNIDSGQQITRFPHANDFRVWRDRLTDDEFNKIVDHLNTLIDGDEVVTSSWIPGDDWSGTVFEPIYYKACKENEELSGLCFGLFVWYVFNERDDEWYCGRFENNGVPIRGMTYFRKKD